MNILKFKDIVLNNDLAKNLTDEQIQIFNNKFKGKYVYAINWYYCVVLEDITPEQFVNLSRSQTVDEQISDYDFLIIEDVESFIDWEKTNKINSIDSLLEINKFVPDDDITLDELKMFRTWLANLLYTTLVDLDYGTKEMLNYYKLEMYDDTIEHLNHFTKVEHDVISSTNLNNCGCHTNTQVLLTNNISTCDPIYIYRKNIYEKMVGVFSDIDFWLKLNKDMLNEIKHYIDNIIKCDLSLYTSEFISDLYDCGCLVNTTAQEERMKILKDLSYCLELLASDNYINKKNHISLTLNKWASLLYERMRWY